MKQLVVTVDVEYAYGPGPQMPRLLGLFSQLGICATLFVTSDVLKQEPDSLRLASQAGHEIASHGHPHPYFFEPGWAKCSQELVEPVRAGQYVADSYEVFKDAGFEVQGFRSIGFRKSQEMLAEAASRFAYFSGLKKPSLPSPTGLKQLDVALLVGNLTYHPALLLALSPGLVAAFLARQPGPVVIYFHSFDLHHFPPNLRLHTSRLKKLIYYQNTGDRLARRITRLIKHMIDKGFSCITAKQAVTAYSL